MDNNMFCYQCQEALNCKGCTNSGVCGKKPSTANLQDMLIYVTKGISEITTIMRNKDISVSTYINRLISENLFVTITNANFDDNMIKARIYETMKNSQKLINENNIKDKLIAGDFICSNDFEIEQKAKEVGVLSTKNEDIRSLKEIITYGLKGISAYIKHSNALGSDSEEINSFLQSTLSKILCDDINIDELISLTIETGKYGVDVMALLDEANTSTYGNPEITQVNIGVRNNPAILVSGHDLKDLEILLKQTENTGVDVYTHSEMLPAHYYPEFKKYSHFVGNYGNAWWKQKDEFELFNGPILLTTNCLVPPLEKYKHRVYTTGVVGFDGCKHIDGKVADEKDFSEIIEHAKMCKPPTEIETGSIVGGFAHNQIIEIADTIVDAVKTGAIKKFVVMAGCDGRSNLRNYYTDFAKSLSNDTVILTSGCAKYRYNKLNLGDIGGIPRVIDAGQCNDSYSLLVVALKLKEIFGFSDINELPIIYNIAWYEQKAVIVLLALLYMGVKNIHLGPTLPAFMSNNVIDILVKNFGISKITDVKSDMNIFFQ